MSRVERPSRQSFDDRDQETDCLFDQMRASADAETRSRLLDSIVRLYVPLCSSMAQRYGGKGVEHDDLVQVARLGLIKAISRYEPGRGRSFAAYAVPTMSGELKRHFRDHGWMVRPPRHIQELRQEVGARKAGIEQELGHSPTDREIAQALDLAADEVAGLARSSSCFRPMSIDTTVAGEPMSLPTAALAVQDSALELVEVRVCLAKGLAALDERAREMVELRFVDGLTQREIGRALGMTQMQVSRALGRVLEQLRSALDADEYHQSA